MLPRCVQFTEKEKTVLVEGLKQLAGRVCLNFMDNTDVDLRLRMVVKKTKSWQGEVRDVDFFFLF